MLTWKSLGSSSRGNAHLLSDGTTTIMFDCGIRYNKIEKELIGVKIDAVVITHEHGDHIQGLSKLIENKNVNVHCSKGTKESIISFGNIHSWQINEMEELKPITIGGFKVTGFEVMHNSEQPFNFLIKHDSGAKIAYITDTGYIYNIEVEDIDYLIIEANFDEDWFKDIASLPKEDRFKVQRLMSNEGHLSVQQASEFINKVKNHNTKKVILCHLSSNLKSGLTIERKVKELTGFDNITALNPKMKKPKEIELKDKLEIPKFE